MVKVTDCFYFGTDYPQLSGLAQPLGLAPKYSRERFYFGA